MDTVDGVQRFAEIDGPHGTGEMPIQSEAGLPITESPHSSISAQQIRENAAWNSGEQRPQRFESHERSRHFVQKADDLVALFDRALLGRTAEPRRRLAVAGLPMSERARR